MASSITFKPKQVVKKLLSALPPRAKDVITGRYGLGADARKMTLESIGKTYKITRERVRQIEAYAINVIRKSELYKKELEAFAELEAHIRKMGGIVPEAELLVSLAKDKSTQNHVHFLLVIGESFKKSKEDEEFQHRWHVDEELSKKIHESLRKLYKGLKDDEILPESEMLAAFLEHVKDVNEEYKKEEILRRWLSMSKLIDKNPLGEWGKSESPSIRAKGIRDYAYLVIRKHGSPIHFREVAKAITQVFGKKAHVATTHNELIKDKRFVLVGRGLYALSEWGYLTGIVRDVIHGILEKHGPLAKKDIIDKVLKERYVKENTILVNLQNTKHFKKDKEGKYSTTK
ncbi:MAG: sigma factor-like helix-turn-helix DNA-binding protein [bacterium]